MAALGSGASLPGWRVRVLDGNHLPASEKRLAPLRGFRGAALPGQSLVVYDPESGLVTDLVACEDAHASERAAVEPLLDSAQPGELWIADRHFCTRTVLQAWQAAGASIAGHWPAIVREHGGHPRLVGQGAWHERGRTETGQIREQAIEVKDQQAPWRRVELALDAPTEDGATTIRMWSNLPEASGAGQIAALYRTRWRIEGLFGRLESGLHSEMASLGHPRAALLGCAVSVLAYNILALLQRCVARAHQRQHEPPPEVSTYHLALQIRDSFQGLLIAVPPEAPSWHTADPSRLVERLLCLARHINPRHRAAIRRRQARRSRARRHQQTKAEAESSQGLCRCQDRTCPRRNRSGPRTSKHTTLKGVGLIPTALGFDARGFPNGLT
jgi:IS4 transposase